MEWISVNDSLPVHGQYVLAYETYPPGTMFKLLAWPLIRCEYQVTEYGTYGKGFVNSKGVLSKYVTHWMPLPAPPNHSPDAGKKVE